MMVGGGKNQEFFQQQLQTGSHASRVILPGWVPHAQAPRYISCMDIVLAPYPKVDFWYPSSVKIFEYMAAGKAVVATDVGQVPEIIEDGVNGYLFDPDREQELGEKIMALVDSSETRRRFGERARHDVEKKWNWKNMAEQMIEVFDGVLQQRRSMR
jgi:glycosyltransferase involved in cell wall biosynthesis